MNGKVHVEVLNSCNVDEVPVLVGNTTRLQLPLINGRVTVQVRLCLCFISLCIFFMYSSCLTVNWLVTFLLSSNTYLVCIVGRHRQMSKGHFSVKC